MLRYFSYIYKFCRLPHFVSVLSPSELVLLFPRILLSLSEGCLLKLDFPVQARAKGK